MNSSKTYLLFNSDNTYLFSNESDYLVLNNSRLNEIFREIDEKFSNVDKRKNIIEQIYDYEVEISSELMKIEDAIIYTEFDIKKLFNDINSDESFSDYYEEYLLCIKKLEDCILKMKLLFHKSNYFCTVLKNKNINNPLLNNVISRLEKNNEIKDKLFYTINEIISYAKVSTNMLMQRVCNSTNIKNKSVFVTFRKRIASTILLFNMLLSSFAIGECVKSKEGNVNIRISASTDSLKIGKITEGEIAYRICKIDDYWSLVLTNQGVGCVYSSLIDSCDKTYDNMYGLVSDSGYCKSSATSLNIRALPDTSSKILGKFNNGSVGYIVCSNDSWYLVGLADDTFGFVSRNYVNKISDDEYLYITDKDAYMKQERQSICQYTNSFVTVIKEDAQLMDNASKDSSLICEYFKGKELGVLSYVDGYYKTVDSKGNIGYIPGDEVSKSGKYPDDFMYTSIVNSNELNVRGTPNKNNDSNIKYTMEKYEIVYVLAECGDWLQVRYYKNDNTSDVGYVYKKYVNRIKVSYVETDISDQVDREVWYIDGKNVIANEFDCITGNVGVSDTPVGEFEYSQLERGHVMKGTKPNGVAYEVYTNYSVKWAHSYHDHDLPNDCPVYGEYYVIENGNGSNGCVRLSHVDAEMLWYDLGYLNYGEDFDYIAATTLEPIRIKTKKIIHR